jgi:hypothetical protein
MPKPTDKVLSIESIIDVSATELSAADANRAIKQVSDMADEASGRVDKLTRFFIAGVAAANAAGLSAALGAIHGDLDSTSPLIVSAILFAVGLTVVLVNPLITLAKDWIEQRRVTREFIKLMSRSADQKPLKLWDVLEIIQHVVPPWWYSPARFFCTTLSVVFFVGGIWWPIVGILRRLLW